MKKPLNVGVIGYGFMGRAHSNAYLQADHFFDRLFYSLLNCAFHR